MEIKETLNRELYNSLTSSSKFIHGFQLWGYGEVKRTQGWWPKRFIIYYNNRIIGYFQLLIKNIFRIKIGIIPFGPVILEDVESYIDIKGVQTCFNCLSKEEKLSILLLHPYFNNNLNQIFSIFPALNQGIGYRYTYIINLQDSLDSIIEGFSSTRRNEIRKSLKENVLRIEHGNTEDLYIRFYNLLKETMKRTKGTCPPFDFFIRIRKEMGNTGNAIVFLSCFEDKDLSGILLLNAGKNVIYQWAALANEEKFIRLNPQKRLIYEAIKWAKQEGYHYFDLGGVSLDQPKGSKKWGIWNFKQSFGGKLIEMPGSFILTGNKSITILMSLYRYYRIYLYKLGFE